MRRPESFMPQLKSSSFLAAMAPHTTVRAERPVLHIHPEGDPARARVEAYIHERYRQRFGAQIKHWMPSLVSLRVGEEILAAAGYRDASEPLFLERYLAAPIEHYLGERGLPVARTHIVETGQFAAVRPGAGRLLVPLLAHHLHRGGFEWAVGTLTQELHHLFSRMGLAHQPLASASARGLSAADRKDWGTYYEHEPKVFAGRLDAILARIPEREA